MKSIKWPGWETTRLIGRGSFGSVYEIQRKVFDDTEKAALKVISIPQSSGDIEEMYSDGYDDESITSTFQSHLKSIVAEYSLMKKMNDCVNIVHCDDVRYVQHDDGIGWDIFIKMELLTPLTRALPVDIPEKTVIKLGMDLCQALVMCNKYGIVHRDIKPQNIFVSGNGDYKLGDFGIAKTVEKTMGGTKIGTYKYMAPEVYNNQPYGSAADIYSLGLVLYWLLNERRMPFMPLPPVILQAGMEVQARCRRFSGETIPAPKNGSDALKAVVLKACAYDPKDRFSSAEKMLDALRRLLPDVPYIPTPSPVPVDVPTNELTNEPINDPLSKSPVPAVLKEDGSGTEVPVIDEPEHKETKKKVKKIYLGILVGVVIVLLLLLMKCGSGNKKPAGTTQTTEGQTQSAVETTEEQEETVGTTETVEETTAENTAVGEATTEESTTESPDDDAATTGGDNQEQIVLRFASWALGTTEENNLERQMIAAFEKAYPNIKIEIAEEITGDWNEALNTAAGGTLPDVSLIATLPTAVANGWALDVSALAAADSEWNNVPASLIESGKYNDKLYGIPTAMHLAGLFINTDYFEEMNVDPLEIGYTWGELESVIEKLHKPSEGKAALRYANDFINFLPYLWDENQGWYTYDGEQMHLDSDEFIRAVKTTNKLVGYSWASLSEDQKALSAGSDKGDYAAWRKGHMGIWYDASYNCEDYKKTLSYEVEFIGLTEGKSVIVPSNYCFISATTEHPQEAWEFVKFMFWGTQGINTRMDLDEADDSVSWSTLPLNTDSAIIDRYFENFPVKGVEEVYRGMNENGSVVEAYMFAPGYSNARWYGKTGIPIGGIEVSMANIIDMCIYGELSIDDYASQLNTLANNFIKAERNAVDKATQ